MYIVLVYDISQDEKGQRRWSRVFKICKKYLSHIQNSVFEGEILPGKLHKCVSELENIIDNEEDSIYIYEIKNSKNIQKNIYGIHKNFDDTFI